MTNTNMRNRITPTTEPTKPYLCLIGCWQGKHKPACGHIESTETLVRAKNQQDAHELGLIEARKAFHDLDRDSWFSVEFEIQQPEIPIDAFDATSDYLGSPI